VEGRRCRVIDVLEGTMANTKRFEDISTRLQHIAELARKGRDWVLTTLAHHIDVDLLREAFRRTRKDGASGVDGQTAEEYVANLEENLQSLESRFKSGTYCAPPVRRTYIPKADGKKTRPIGIPTFEDKVLQRALTMVLESVYEQDFLDCSYGFRPGRSSHQALEALWKGLMNMGGGWVLEVDIKGFFDSLDHKHLRDFLDQRVRDGVIRRAIGKWLNAGVLEEGSLRYPETGSPQGGVISPLLANIYLHEVLDKWFERDVKPRLRGRAFIIRYADDFVIVFPLEEDARRVLEVLPKRFGKYGLELHPEKTRLIPFRRPVQKPGTRDDIDKTAPGSFDLLGFTHFWGTSRKGDLDGQTEDGRKPL
jgi:group II intron reverse transcriptase/maturase